MDVTMVYHSNFQVDPKDDARRKGEVVHSGHFMMSSVADDEDEIDDIRVHDRDSPIHHEQSIMIKHGYDFSNVPKETKNTYQFGPLPSNKITIDVSLSRLFRCMSLAYHGGKVVSPKWKNFRGMRLTVKDKIRLNNAIWRTWHIQYVMRRKKKQSFIQFSTPLNADYNSHSKPEAVVMEGKYWKRRIETVVEEYKKWRAFHMEKWAMNEQKVFSKSLHTQPYEDQHCTDFTDTLFTNLSQQPTGIQFPNPREIAMHATNSDMMQPGLLQLQPVVDDDYMEFDLQDFLNQPRLQSRIQFTGVNSHNQNSGDIFSTTDFSSIMDHSLLQQSNNMTTSQKSMDFLNTFEREPTKELEFPTFNDPLTSADPIFSSVNINTVPRHYSSNNTLQQQGRVVQQQSHAMQRPNQTVQQQNQVVSQSRSPASNTPTLNPNYNFQTKQLRKSDSIRQQPSYPKLHDHEMTNVTYLAENNNGNQQTQGNVTIYPQSKLHQNRLDKVIYATSQPTMPTLEFVPNNQNQLVQLVQTDGSGLLQVSQLQPAAVYDPKGTPSVHLATTRMTNETPNVQNDHQQQPAFAVAATTADLRLLKQLLTNSPAAAKATAPTMTRKTIEVPSVRRGSSASVLHSNETVHSNILVKQSSLPAFNTMQLAGVPDISTENVSNEPKTGGHTSPWPAATNRSKEVAHSSAMFKPISPDVEMKQGSQLARTASQEQDSYQMELLQKSGSFSAEQKRRFNIKMGFTRLQQLLPSSSTQVNSKASKATLMSKAVQHIKLLQSERMKISEEIQVLKQDLEKLKRSISHSQQQLPDTGAPIARPRIEEGKNQFKTWVKHRTRYDWKFYIFGVVIRPWFDSYQRMVSVSSSRELCRTVLDWVDQCCSLSVLRPSVVQSLQILCTTTPILTNASRLRQQIEESASQHEEEERSSGR